MPSRRSLLSFLAAPALAGGMLPMSGVLATPGMPELVGNDAWLNTDRPLTLAGQRGRVVLVEFGTYTCINWRRTLPYVNRWYSQYGPQGLQVITSLALVIALAVVSIWYPDYFGGRKAAAQAEDEWGAAITRIHRKHTAAPSTPSSAPWCSAASTTSHKPCGRSGGSSGRAAGCSSWSTCVRRTRSTHACRTGSTG